MERTRLLIAPLLTLILLSSAAAGCGLHISLDAEAQEAWNREYTLEDGGTLEIRNTNGRIQVEVGEGDAVTIMAERTVKAATEEAARDALESFEIRETVSPDRIVLDSTSGDLGFTFNLSRRVDYTIRLPRSAGLTIRTTNGDVDATGLGGRFDVDSTNGRVVASGLEGEAAVETTNGTISLTMARLSPGGVSCETTNGRITLSLPSGIDADLSAQVTNGSIDYSGIDLNVLEESRRRLDARIGEGGPEIRLHTTNGRIRVEGAR